METAQFHTAIQKNDLETVKRGLAETPELLETPINDNNGKFQTPLQVAVQWNMQPLAELLLEKGANLNGTLTLAYSRHNVHLASILFGKGAINQAKHPERNIDQFKAFISADDHKGPFDLYYRIEDMKAAGTLPRNVVEIPKPESTFDKMVRAIKGNPETKQLAKLIPSETTRTGAINPDFAAFGEVCHHARSVSEKLSPESDPYRLMPLLLENSYQKNWQESAKRLSAFTARENNQLRDAINGFADTVVMPELARKTKFLLTSGTVNYEDLKTRIVPEIAKAMIGNRSLAVVYDLQRDWHADLTMLETTIRNPKYGREGKWPPLMPPTALDNGYTISFVTTSAELQHLHETEHLHCIAGYTSKCLSTPTHIGTLKNDGKIRSTFELNEDPAEKLKIIQNMHYDNQEVPQGSPEDVALKGFVSKVRSGALTFDSDKLAEERFKCLAANKDVRRICGFDVFYEEKTPSRGDEKTASECETNALRQYCKIITGGRDGTREGQPKSVISNTRHAFVPGGKEKWGNKTAKEFLTETGLMTQIDKIANELQGQRPPRPEGFVSLA